MIEGRDGNIAKIVVVGHVDHGKSTLLGRLLIDCNQVSKEEHSFVEGICEEKERRFEPAYLLDALEEEQDEGLSIDTTRVRLNYRGRRFLLIDAPGHIEFLRNMTTGASDAGRGIVVVDGLEGIKPQTKRHIKILHMLGIKQIIAVVNKIDLLEFDKRRFESVKAKIEASLNEANLDCVSVIPASALAGINISSTSSKTPWYEGQALLPLLADLEEQQENFAPDSIEPLRMLLQDVYRFDGDPIYAGRVVSGEIAAGDEIMFFPSGKIATVESIESYPEGKLIKARKGDSTAIRLKEDVFVDRGEIISTKYRAPVVDTTFNANLVWLSNTSFDPEEEYILKVGTKESFARVEAEGNCSGNIENGDILPVRITAHNPVAFDIRIERSSASSALINRLVLCSAHETIAAGTICEDQSACTSSLKLEKSIFSEKFIEREDFERRQGNRGAVIWLTGLSGSGKSTLARALEDRIFGDHLSVKVLDGDNVRKGLNSDLKFSQEDRAENIRRMAHVARLFLDTGTIVIVSCISPYQKDREIASQIVGREDFNEVFVFCPMEICQARDPKGLYKRGSSGKIRNMTGIQSPYQPPLNPDLRLNSSKMTVSEEVEEVMSMLEKKGVLKSGRQTAETIELHSKASQLL